MDLRYYPDPILREECTPVREFGPALADLADEMVALMHEAEGLGLAAPQVGIAKRLVLVSADGRRGNVTVLANPEIVGSDGWEEADEGCLSFPGVYVKIGRFLRVRVRYQDVKGTTCELEADGLLARAIQHELDHIDGRLLVDRMSVVQRMAHRRRLRELRDQHEQRMSQAG